MIVLLRNLLQRYRYRCTDEKELQEAIAAMLDQAGFDFEREKCLSKASRVDFWFPDGVALEVKTEGAYTAVLRQLHRYAEHPDVRAVILATTRELHRRMPESLCGKPVHVVMLPAGLL
jgi:hypothetical protein